MATPPASLSPTITMRPGPKTANSIRNRCQRLRPSIFSCCPMVPRAPTMSPTCALSMTARMSGDVCRRRTGVRRH
ncbi:Uncharacterised protein [Mycobacteroides abscessus subsp. abscessus]|nr:Uncharacterised protein [Mycobacteroides abscessus subsp. abscessus]